MKKGNPLRAKFVCIFVAIILVLQACALKTSKKVSLTSSTDRKIPIRVGYYPSDFAKLGFYKKTIAGYSYLKVGGTLSKGVEGVLKNCFEDVVKLDPSQRDLTSYGINAVVIPEIASMDMLIRSFGSEQAIVKMKWSIFDTEHNMVWVDTISGEAEISAGVNTIFSRKMLMERAIQDQFQKALESILRYEWWKKLE